MLCGKAEKLIKPLNVRLKRKPCAFLIIHTAHYSDVSEKYHSTVTDPNLSMSNLNMFQTTCMWMCFQSLTFLPTYTGMPIIMAGIAMPAMSAMPTGAPTSVPSCQRIFFFLLHGFFPQKVQPDGLRKRQRENKNIFNIYLYFHILFIQSIL